MAKKQTFVVGSTNAVTQSLTDAQLNTAWNQFEVLKAGELDGVLNAMSKQTAINADEITNALDVYNITPDPTDNTQLKQLLTQMDNKIDQAVSGGEIIGSFWYGQTTPGFTVPAPTMIGQTYIDFTTLNHYISNDGSTWTLNGTLTLPSTQDAIVLITAKFWDIIEQQNQYGGRAIYSQDLTQWIYYPTIMDLSGYAHTNMDNLDSTGANIANWSSNVTKCITEIPQDIKLELAADGTLTLKAGSKVYVPNGTGVFDEVTITSDITYTYTYGAYTLGLYYNPISGYLEAYTKNAEVSGTTPANTCTFYNISTNNISRINNGTVATPKLSFPIATITTNASQITSIDQVFNGFGYIGSTRFVLPNIKWLSPDGRNADGTLKSIQRTNTNVLVETVLSGTVNNIVMVLGTTTIWTSGKYIESETEPSGNYIIWYKPSENILRDKADGNWNINNNVVVYGYYDAVSSQITSFRTKQPFHAVDYSDLQQVYKNLQPVLENDFYSAPNWTAQTNIASGTTITKIGYVYAYTAGSDHSLLLSINGNQVGGSSSSHAGKSRSGLCAVGVGDVVTATGSSPTIYFVPCLLS